MFHLEKVKKRDIVFIIIFVYFVFVYLFLFLFLFVFCLCFCLFCVICCCCSHALHIFAFFCCLCALLSAYWLCACFFVSLFLCSLSLFALSNLHTNLFSILRILMTLIVELVVMDQQANKYAANRLTTLSVNSFTACFCVQIKHKNCKNISCVQQQREHHH